MWIIFKPPPNPVDFVLLTFHTESFVELVLGKDETEFKVVIQKPFGANSSDKSVLHYVLGTFDNYSEGLEHALEIVSALKNDDRFHEIDYPFDPQKHTLDGPQS